MSISAIEGHIAIALGARAVRKNTMTANRFFVVALMMLSMAACRGGGAEVSSTVEGATLGQQLQDLENARTAGLISEDEYQGSREAIMERYNQ
jgi:hypothetical protein